MSKKEFRRAKSQFFIPERTNLTEQWSQIAEFVMPNQSGIFDNATATQTDPGTNTTAGAKKTRRVYDSTAIQANHDLGSSIHSTLTNPQIKWSRIRFADESLNNNDQAVAWLEMANDKIHRALNESNFDTEVARNYLSYCSLGTMVLFHETKNDESLEFSGFNFRSIHLSEIAYEEDHEGKVNRVYRKFQMTAEQIMKRFPNPGDKVMEIASKDPTKKITILHATGPRERSSNDFVARPMERPIFSYFFDYGTGHKFHESGYYELPYYVTRWSVMPGEVYGRSPGHIALGDIRTLNKLKKLMLSAMAKAVNPPVMAAKRSVFGTLDLRPNKINIVSDPNNIKEFQTTARFDVTSLGVQELQNQIKSVFFLDKLMLPPRTETGEMTAFEVSQRLQQMQKVLGPVLGRLNSEFLSPLITRSFQMLLRGAELNPLPPVLRQTGLNVDISFVNSLSQSQQLDEVNSIREWVNSLAMMAQVAPEALDYINADAIAKHLRKSMFVPEIAIRSDGDVQTVRQARAQQQQMEQGLAAAQQASQVVKNLPEDSL